MSGTKNIIWFLGRQDTSCLESKLLNILLINDGRDLNFALAIIHEQNTPLLGNLRPATLSPICCALNNHRHHQGPEPCQLFIII